jgi:transcriptional regulator with XRE-family HTH domain
MTDDGIEDESTHEYAAAVGARIRAVRRQRRMSLRAVEELSGNEFRASVLGAYERGERSISVRRLQRLSHLYNVPVDQLLPPPGPTPAVATPVVPTPAAAAVAVESVRAPVASRSKVVIDLAKLSNSRTAEAELLRHLLAAVQVQRQDFNGRMMTIRGDDLRVISALFGRTVEGMIASLGALDLLHRP